MTVYRLLNEGEIIQEGDEFYSEFKWSPVSKTVYGFRLNCGNPHRRPLSPDLAGSPTASNPDAVERVEPSETGDRVLPQLSGTRKGRGDSKVEAPTPRPDSTRAEQVELDAARYRRLRENFIECDELQFAGRLSFIDRQIDLIIAGEARQGVQSSSPAQSTDDGEEPNITNWVKHIRTGTLISALRKVANDSESELYKGNPFRLLADELEK